MIELLLILRFKSHIIHILQPYSNGIIMKFNIQRHLHYQVLIMIFKICISVPLIKEELLLHVNKPDLPHALWQIPGAHLCVEADLGSRTCKTLEQKLTVMAAKCTQRTMHEKRKCSNYLNIIFYINDPPAGGFNG